ELEWRAWIGDGDHFRRPADAGDSPRMPLVRGADRLRADYHRSDCDRGRHARSGASTATRAMSARTSSGAPMFRRTWKMCDETIHHSPTLSTEPRDAVYAKPFDVRSPGFPQNLCGSRTVGRIVAVGTGRRGITFPERKA